MSENLYAPPQSEVGTLKNDPSDRRQGPYGPYRDLRVLRGVIIFFFVGLIALLVFQAMTTYQFAEGYEGVMREATKPDFTGPPADLMQLEVRSVLLGQAALGVLVFIVIFWCIWKNLSCKNAWLFGTMSHSLHRRSKGVTPGWAVGWYFIPVAHLWKPVEAMFFIKRQLGSQQPSSMLIAAWWGTWVLMNLSSNIKRAFNEIPRSPLQFVEQLRIDVYLAPLKIFAALLAVGVIIVMTKAQHTRARRLGLTR